MHGIPPREIKQIQTADSARNTVLEGVRKGYEAVSVTYGPSGENVLQGMPFGDPVLTRDGVTVAKRVILEDRAENDAWSVMRQAAEKTNKTAGDATTTTVVLGYHLLKNAHRLVAAGENPMKLKAQLVKDSRKVIKFLQGKSVDAKKYLLEVATVSAGDPNIGALVADTLKDIGVDGGITIREQSYPTIDVDKINGYYFNRGFFALNQQVEWEKPHILVTQKPLTTAGDMLPLIQHINQQSDKKLVIIGEVRGDALQLLLANTATTVDPQGRPIPFEGIVVPPPAYGDEAKLYMEDIAIYLGCRVFTEAEEQFTTDHFGTAKRVQVNQDRAILLNGNGDADAITTRAAQIKKNIDAETDPHTKDGLEQRYSKLVGKIAIVNVGASTPTEMEELRFRVEDAIEATKSAMQDGVLPGSGVGLVASAHVKDISPLFKSALLDTIKKLYDNAGEDPGYRIKQIENAQFGFGFNLRDMTEEPIDLTKSGIWDATRAVVQTVENATSAAGALLTVGAMMTPYDDEPTGE
jgi:chaperonin GroEL